MQGGFRTRKASTAAGLGLCALLSSLSHAGGPGQTQIPSRLNDFRLPGTQPEMLNTDIQSSESCASCHGFIDESSEPFKNWAASMMGQSMRDPLFLAAMTIANQDAAFAGDLCLRCHTPGGWLDGRSTPTDGSALTDIDRREGINCNFCHRMVDPEYQAGVSPLVDFDILDNLGVDAPTVAQSHSGAYVVDPEDRRRGPVDLGEFATHEWEISPFHSSSSMCATCHDVSNPMYTAQPDGTYTLNDLNTPHPTNNVYDTFPVERTYSEWVMSEFAQNPIAIGDRYETTLAEVSSCQDCHMPEVEDKSCHFGEVRSDMSIHSFNGGNNWVLNAIRNLHEDSATFLSESTVAQSISRAEGMLRSASDMELSMLEGDLNVRIINQTGHKLPTGYPEGRRMWINVQYFDASDTLVGEHGAYDDTTAVLTTGDTKVYEAKLGVDAAVSALTGVPEGPAFHFALVNKRYKDNRIPPRGFTNVNFEAVQAEPVAYSYNDGEYWDDTQYAVPAGATKATVRLYYQSASKEYIEFLRDENTTDTHGQTIYDQWVATGKSPIVEMDIATLMLEAPCPADLTGDGELDFFDVSDFLDAFGAQDPIADFTGDGEFDFFDVSDFLDAFGAGCP